MKRLLLIILVLLLVFTSFAASNTSKIYEKAMDKMSQGAYEEAASLFESISTYEDASKLSMYCKALAYGEAGQYDMAIRALEILGEYKDCAYYIKYYSICSYVYSDYENINDYAYNLLYAAYKFDSIFIFRDLDSLEEWQSGLL